jgi:hypothetical protein
MHAKQRKIMVYTKIYQGLGQIMNSTVDGTPEKCLVQAMI